MVNISESSGVKVWLADDKQETCTVVFLSVGKQVEPMVFADSVSKKRRREEVTKRTMTIMEEIHSAQEQQNAARNKLQAIGPAQAQGIPTLVPGQNPAAN